MMEVAEVSDCFEIARGVQGSGMFDSGGFAEWHQEACVLDGLIVVESSFVRGYGGQAWGLCEILGYVVACAWDRLYVATIDGVTAVRYGYPIFPEKTPVYVSAFREDVEVRVPFVFVVVVRDFQHCVAVFDCVLPDGSLAESSECELQEVGLLLEGGSRVSDGQRDELPGFRFHIVE